MAPTQHAKTVDALLHARGFTLDEFIGLRRESGMSYNRIAKALSLFTEGIVDVTGETIRNWSVDYDQTTTQEEQTA